jgi:predicted metal-dependent phosphotriesterase family hydrolase
MEKPAGRSCCCAPAHLDDGVQEAVVFAGVVGQARAGASHGPAARLSLAVQRAATKAARVLHAGLHTHTHDGVRASELPCMQVHIGALCTSWSALLP